MPTGLFFPILVCAPPQVHCALAWPPKTCNGATRSQRCLACPGLRPFRNAVCMHSMLFACIHCRSHAFTEKSLWSGNCGCGTGYTGRMSPRTRRGCLSQCPFMVWYTTVASAQAFMLARCMQCMSSKSSFLSDDPCTPVLVGCKANVHTNGESPRFRVRSPGPLFCVCFAIGE